MFIGVEWTSSSFAAELIEADGTMIAEVRDPSGTVSVADRRFAERFAQLVPPDWLSRADAVYFSGMVTGRGGWVETGFAATPASLADLAASAVGLSDGPVPLVFLPGVSSAGVLPDVMRGEEIKALAAGAGRSKAMVVMPGAHTKYVALEEGRIIGLATYMGGEARNLLSRDSLISRLIPADASPSAAGFERGLHTAWDEAIAGSLLRRLFSARSLVLFERMPAEDIAGYIAGLVAGAEIAEAESEWHLRDGPVLVIGSGLEAARYREALVRRGIDAQPVTASTAVSLAQVHQVLFRQG